ncbi:MAG TPA: thrombospondin type 3 repeat-containing protein, partial [Verrucomicrobiae bacterium]|nr:thrombospondin type 3 repeat-containing protein [Verrucomicrobiae bacterium]
GGDEFVEIANITSNPIPLFDPMGPTNTWRLNGLGFEFPTNVTLGAQGVALLVATNPASFRTKYNVPESVLIFGPYSGEMQDSGERLRLERPSMAQETNGLDYIVVDDVRYYDKAPWPPAADGGGASLQRIGASAFGNDPANWRAGVPSPGRDYVNGDADGDGLPDDWEILNGTNPSFADADEDPDGDGLTNAEEHAAGTSPNDPGSTLRVDEVTADGTQVVLTFHRAADRAYRVLYKNSLTDPAWLKLTDVPASGTAGAMTVTDTAPPALRFYRIVTP